MSIRTFVFCDICNTKGIRVVEERRSTAAFRENTGRRISDGRSWFDGSLAQALTAGWYADQQGRHVCPRCFSRGLHLLEDSAEPPSECTAAP